MVRSAEDRQHDDIESAFRVDPDRAPECVGTRQRNEPTGAAGDRHSQSAARIADSIEEAPPPRRLDLAGRREKAVGHGPASLSGGCSRLRAGCHWPAAGPRGAARWLPTGGRVGPGRVAAGGPGSPIERRGAPLEPSMTIRSGEPPARHGLFQRRGVQAGNVT